MDKFKLTLPCLFSFGRGQMIIVSVGARAMFYQKRISQKPFLDPLCNCILVRMIADDIFAFLMYQISFCKLPLFLYKQNWSTTLPIIYQPSSNCSSILNSNFAVLLFFFSFLMNLSYMLPSNF